MSDCPKTGYLGPTGTWAEEALLANTSCKAGEVIPYPSVYEVIAAVSHGETEQGIVPMENAIEGSVSATLDILTFDVDNVLITREIVHPIRHRLIARSNFPMSEIKKIVSHPHAHAQCRRFVREHVPQAELVAANSTAEAVLIISRSDERWAAIGSSLAAKNYGCVVLENDIEDYPDNQTRFVMLSQKAAPQDLGASYKTSIVCSIAHDRPGSLLEILQEFAQRFVNLTKIESRPSKKGLGDYVFFIDMEGKKDDPAVAPALRNLESRLNWVKLLGSYPIG